jgi:predicted membrane chloride channel (bestrophin family)
MDGVRFADAQHPAAKKHTFKHSRSKSHALFHVHSQFTIPAPIAMDHLCSMNRTIWKVNSASDSVFRVTGSVLNDIALPVIFTGLIAYGVGYYKENEIDMTILPVGHQMAGALLAFFLVFHNQMCLQHYKKGQSNLQKIGTQSVHLVRTYGSYLLQNVERNNGHNGMPATAFLEKLQEFRRMILLQYSMLLVGLDAEEFVSLAELTATRPDAPSLTDLSDEAKECIAPVLNPEEYQYFSTFNAWHASHTLKKDAPQELFLRVSPVVKTRLGLHLAETGVAQLHPALLGQLTSGLASLFDLFDETTALKFTPTPVPYVQILRIYLLIFVFTIPFCSNIQSLSHTMPYVAPITSIVIAIGYFGIFAISSEMEDPFGNDENDLPTDRVGLVLEAQTFSVIYELRRKCFEEHTESQDQDLVTAPIYRYHPLYNWRAPNQWDLDKRAHLGTNKPCPWTPSAAFEAAPETSTGVRSTNEGPRQRVEHDSRMEFPEKSLL